MDPGDARRFFHQVQQRIALGPTEPAPPVLTEEEDNEGENQAEADGKRERNDDYGGG
jgi:hypothetical protein